jgi:hypothetical protein
LLRKQSLPVPRIGLATESGYEWSGRAGHSLGVTTAHDPHRVSAADHTVPRKVTLRHYPVLAVFARSEPTRQQPTWMTVIPVRTGLTVFLRISRVTRRPHIRTRASQSTSGMFHSCSQALNGPSNTKIVFARDPWLRVTSRNAEAFRCETACPAYHEASWASWH